METHGRHALSHAALLVLLLALPMLAAGQPWSRCDLSGSGAAGRKSYSEGSKYEQNLNSLLQVLRAGSSSSPALFSAGASSTGATDAAYGLILCRGDLNVSDCYDCGTRAIQDVAAACNRSSRDMALVYNQCYVRLSDANFLGSKTSDAGKVRLVSGQSITSRDVAGYSRAVTDLLGATVRHAVESSSPSSGRMFATGEWTGTDTGFPRIYAMAQCTPDVVTPVSCGTCLQELLSEWWGVFPRNGTGARIVGSWCNLRAEMSPYPFYSGSAMVRLPHATGPPAPL